MQIRLLHTIQDNISSNQSPTLKPKSLLTRRSTFMGEEMGDQGDETVEENFDSMFIVDQDALQVSNPNIHIIILYHYPISSSRIIIPYHYPILLSRIIIPYHHPVLLSHIIIPYYYPVSLSRITIPDHHSGSPSIVALFLLSSSSLYCHMMYDSHFFAYSFFLTGLLYNVSTISYPILRINHFVSHTSYQSFRIPYFVSTISNPILRITRYIFYYPPAPSF